MSEFLLPWTEEVCLEANNMNGDHHRLLDRLNRVIQAIEAHDFDAVVLAANVLINEAQTHFADEEASMAATGYPGLELHREHHQKLMEGLASMRFRVSTAFDDKDLVGLSAQMEHWFAPHIADDDNHFAAFLNSRVERRSAPRAAPAMALA